MGRDAVEWASYLSLNLFLIEWLQHCWHPASLNPKSLWFPCPESKWSSYLPSWAQGESVCLTIPFSDFQAIFHVKPYRLDISISWVNLPGMLQHELAVFILCSASPFTLPLSTFYLPDSPGCLSALSSSLLFSLWILTFNLCTGIYWGANNRCKYKCMQSFFPCLSRDCFDFLIFTKLQYWSLVF